MKNTKVKEKSTFLSGWGTWAGDSKEVQTKEFLRKKRFDFLVYFILTYSSKRRENLSNNLKMSISRSTIQMIKR